MGFQNFENFLADIGKNTLEIDTNAVDIQTNADDIGSNIVCSYYILFFLIFSLPKI